LVFNFPKYGRPTPFKLEVFKPSENLVLPLSVMFRLK